MSAWYGVDLRKVKWKKDVCWLIINLFYITNDKHRAEYAEWCAENGFSTEDDESKTSFANELLSRPYFWADIDMLTDIINQDCFGGTKIFRYDDFWLYVEAYIPDDEDRVKIPTKRQIQAILAKYLNPLIQEPVVPEFCPNCGARMPEHIDLEYKGVRC